MPGQLMLQRKKIMDFTEGPIIANLLKFSLPIAIGSLFNLAYGMADLRIIGSFLGTDSLAAVGSVSTFSDLVSGFLFGIANGFAVITSQQFGAKKDHNVRRVFAMSLSMGEAITVVISLLSILCLPFVLNLLNVDPVYHGDATQYLTIIMGGMIFSFMYNVLAANLRAIGDAYTPLLFLILSACINVGLDLLFVGAFHLDVRGTALATILSQLISVILCSIYIRYRHPMLRVTLKETAPQKEFVRPMFASGISMALMSSLVNFGTVSLQSAINGLGENTIVAHAATRRLTFLFMMPYNAMATSMATFCGQNYGAKRMDRIRKGLTAALLMGAAWVVCVQIIANTVCGTLITLITAQTIPEIVNTAVLYQRVDTAFYLAPMAISTLRTSLQGMTDTRTPIVSSSLELVGKLVFAFALTPVFGYNAIIATEPVVWNIMVIPLIISTIRRVRKDL